MRVVVTSEWLTLSPTTATVDNCSSETIELCKVSESEGVYIYPKQHFAYDDMSMKIRCVGGAEARINVVDYVQSTHTSNAEQIGSEVIKADNDNTAGKTDMDALF